VKVLITGAAGFTGRHLSALLSKEAGNQLVLIDRKASQGILSCDLAKPEEVEGILKDQAPDQIYHLAGTFTNDYGLDHASNVESSKNLLDAVVKLKLNPKILLVGSAAEYGDVPEAENPVKENRPLRPVSVYGLTKAMQTQLMLFYAATTTLRLVMARTFNLMGKGVSDRLFVGKIYQQIDELKKNKLQKITTGFLGAERDYLPVEEAVRKYKVLMEKGAPGEVYNVGSGKGIKMSSLLYKILQENGLSMDVVLERAVEATPKHNVMRMVADTGKLTALESGKKP
jgi:GDP-4-dehydro-6-deoxy-D-mannose reductase